MKQPSRIALPSGSEELRRFDAALEARTPIEYEGKQWYVVQIEQRPSDPSDVFVRLQYVPGA
jgi:hypothetical protein